MILQPPIQIPTPDHTVFLSRSHPVATDVEDFFVASLSLEQGTRLAAKVLDGSLRLLDVCSTPTAIDIQLYLKESVDDPERILQRSRGEESIQEFNFMLFAKGRSRGWLKSSKEAPVSESSICTQLASRRNLHEDINKLIQLPSLQKALIIENMASESLDRSLKLIGICGIAGDIIFFTKESVQELESSLRRNRGIDAYMTSRKQNNRLTKCYYLSSKPSLKKIVLQSFLMDVKSSLRRNEGVDAYMNSRKTSTELVTKKWSLVSKFTQSSHVHSWTEDESNAQELYALNIEKLQKDVDKLSVQNVTKLLKESEMTIQELEENLKAFIRSLVKTRVSLLNVLSH
ncbi:unnamed protein product [Fraxinus pennsylvanica]|uniref:Uncharacterized protein n=1 Tax=Fraxinus pennsylvanica TaxID=56036 RepID=A0AAD2E5F1_9LAMI|nr:unnamed protein product [Fraxinus pennsylvanica]